MGTTSLTAAVADFRVKLRNGTSAPPWTSSKHSSLSLSFNLPEHLATERPNLVARGNHHNSPEVAATVRAATTGSKSCGKFVQSALPCISVHVYLNSFAAARAP